MKSNYMRTIHFLCEDKNVRHSLVDNIEKRIGLEIPYLEPAELMLALQRNKHRILMIDHRHYFFLIKYSLSLTYKISNLQNGQL